MFGFNAIGWKELVFIALLAVCIFGLRRLPAVVRDFKETLRIIRGGFS